MKLLPDHSLTSWSKEFTTEGDIIVFSHLRWDFVTQRPQHIMRRLAKNHTILFVEESIRSESDKNLETRTYNPEANIHVIQPSPSDGKNGGNLAKVIRKICNEKNIQPSIAWFYSAAFVDMLHIHAYDIVIYDCMDELTAFAGANSLLKEQERELLKKTDIVFTGGRSLYEAKVLQHDNVYCYPSSVDKKHFEHATTIQTPIPEDLKKIPKPIVGFYGVIDERIDYKLLSVLVRRLPQYSFVMIGPYAKIDPASIPKFSNLYYLGEKKYTQLPEYLKYFDVAMMPFARNEATRFISPTKTLEYLAAERPVISTPITDVVRDFSKIVTIAYTPEEFAFRLVDVMNEHPEIRKKRLLMSRRKVSETSWDQTVQSMQEHIYKWKQTGQQEEVDQENLVLPTFPQLRLSPLLFTKG